MIRSRTDLALAAALIVGACSGQHGNFSQYPGFADWYAAHPPSQEVPSPADQELLARYLPRFYLATGQDAPVDFYADYVAHGRLLDGSGEVIATDVDRELLNRWKSDPTVVFEHEPPPTGPASHAVAYGRVDRDRPPLPGVDAPWTFLTWNLVFAESGLPAGLPGWAEALVDALASPTDWHQLDHYTAVTLALDEAISPVAVTFQQHNMTRTYVLGEDLSLPPDGRLEVAIARRSNELFPRPAGTARYRTVDFGTPENMRYMMTGEHGPWLRADDIVEAGREIPVELAFLPPADAFYTFQGYLGARRALPGRDGPPGADYNTLPPLKPRGMQMLAGYWREGSQEDLAALDAAGGEPTAYALGQVPSFSRSLAAARQRVATH